MRVAALQFQPHFLQKEFNLSVIEKYLTEAECDLIVLPELCLSGYFFSSREELITASDPLDGKLFSFFASFASKKNMGIVLGFAEKDCEKIYNSAALITPHGIEGVYRKVHLFGEEKIYFTPGDSGFKIFEYLSSRIGIMICYDWRFPESVRTLTLRGAEIICHPSNLITPAKLWKSSMQTRSFENKVFTITANRIGTESNHDSQITFTGCSQITNYNGDILVELNSSEEGIIYAHIDPTFARKKSFSEWNDIIADRRPEMYELS